MTADVADTVIGRDTELEAVRRFLAAFAEGPAALMIRGEPGIGKTTIWHAATGQAQRAGLTVLSCRPGSAEAHLPYAGLSDLFAPVDDDLLHRLPAPQRRALDIALLRVDAGSSPLQQRAVSAAALNVVVELARSAPVLLAIDDLQWLDPPSVRVLRFVLRRLGSAHVGVLVASRSGLAEEDRLELADALSAEHLERLALGPVELPALARLLRAHLRDNLSGPTVRRVHETSGGNPFFAIELGRALLDPDADTVPGQPFPAPPSLQGLLAARLARVSLPTRQALLAASALSRPTVDLVLAATARPGVDDESLDPALDPAIDAEVITVHGGVVRFTHPLLSSVLYAEASAEERRRLHRRLADLVVDAEERARHLGLSADQPDSDIAAALDAAACRAASRGAPDAAAVLLEQAADLSPAPSINEILRRKLDAADQHIAAGDTTRARDLLESVSSMPDGGVARARALHRLGRIAVLEGDLLPVPQVLQQALLEVRDDLPLRASIERDLVWALAQVGAVSQAVPHAVEALRAAEDSGQLVLVAEALDHLCMADFLAGGDIDPELLNRAIAVDEQVGTAPQLPHPGIAAGRLPLALTLKWTDDFGRARSLLESLHRQHLEHGDEGALAPVLFHLGELECWAGNWQEAARLAEQSHDLATRAGQGVAERRALTLDAMVASYRGDAEAASSIGSTSLELAEHNGDSPAVIRSLKSLGMIELSNGNTERAVGHFERAIKIEAAAGFDPATVRVMPDAIEALISVGRLAEATPLVEELQDRGARSNRPWALATGARCRGLLDSASGRLDTAQTALEAAVHAHERLPQPFEYARTLLALGSVQRRVKHKRAARDALEEAMRCFDELGATLWAARARTELRRIPGRTSSPLVLTPTEEQVARLVADGLTNREVAMSLFMSAKTVEANLTHIYRKLGVTSRRELGRRMRDTPE